MLLSSIEVQGFKSFADKTVLKFGKGITAVVGPNGSGKSNISDAVRWVLGEQSTKSLRGQSMEDVIFSGTENRRAHGFCEVTLNINNDDRTLNFDNDTVSVTRRFYRSHESEYSINGIAVRLRDIHELFMDTGLGRDGYSMIGQGKIDNIISSKSGERRDIFEEAAGISKYRYRKLDAERKLTSAEDNLLRLHDILDELKSRVGPLEEQSKKAEKFLSLASQKKELEIGLWLYTLEYSKEAIREQESKIALSQLSYNQIEEELADFDEKTEKNTSYFARLTSRIEGERLNISEINQDIVKENGLISVLENDIVHNNDSIKRLNDELSLLKGTDSEAKTEIEEKDKLAEQKSNELSELNEKLDGLNKELSELLSDSENISQNIEEKIMGLNKITSILSDKRVEKVTADTALNEISLRLVSVNELINSKENEFLKLDKDYSDTLSAKKQIEEDIKANLNVKKGYELKLKSKIDIAKKYKEQLDELKLENESKKRKIRFLEELQNNMEGFSKSVKIIKKQADIGLLNGICGTVSSVIKVDKEYSVAIETALGNSIQHIITETENDAKHAINYLKTNDGGRATFLPVKTIKAREFKEHGFENMYGFLGIASDIVKTDEKYKEIIKYLLGAVVVAEDINTATAIAKKFDYRIKIVSLDGQIVNPGGSLTGGSQQRNSGLLSRATDIEKLKNELEALNKKIEQTEKLALTATEELAQINAEITSINAEISNLSEDNIRADGEIKRIGELKNNADKAINDLKNEIENGDKKQNELKEISEKSKNEISLLEENKNNLQNEINSMSGGRENLNLKRENISNEITSLKLNIIEYQKDYEALILAKDNLLLSIANRNRRVEEIDLELKEINSSTELINNQIITKNNKKATLEKDILNSQTTIDDFILKRNETEKIGIELRASEKEKTTLREKISGDLARLNERKDVMNREYDDVIKQLYDEYQLTRSQAEGIGIRIDNPKEAKKNLAETKAKIRNLGSVNVSAIEEYKEVSTRFNFLNEQINDVENSRTELHKLINQLTTQMQEIFITGFYNINENFKKTFTELFGGGTASLTLSEPENVLESGIDINVKLPGKNVPSLDGLSGGEKALIALSIYFAIMRVNAPPFCFLDEVDTALDDINVDRFANYMKKSDFSTQFICVTHRRGTMEAADMLYGVTMQEKGITKLLELNVGELEKKLLEKDK